MHADLALLHVGLIRSGGAHGLCVAVGWWRSYWGGPLWRDRFLLWFLDPKLASTKITFFHSLKEQKVGKTSEI